MSPRHTPVSGTQLGFDSLLTHAEAENATRKLARECAHLPGTMNDAVHYLQALIARHHDAMLKGDAALTMRLRKDADRLAEKLNNFEPGTLAGPDAPGCLLDRLTRAPEGSVPLWGQSGSFAIDVGTMRIRISIEGIFSLSADVYHWLGFGAHAVDFDKPFLSETGFRSFIAIGSALEAGFTPDAFAREVLTEFVTVTRKGKLVAIRPEHRPQEARP